MISLPDRYVYIPLSLPAVRQFLQPPNEKYISLWMWVNPRLLGWSRRVYWLFSSAIDARRKIPGDLWGIDSEGTLIIVETRYDRVAGPKNPFKSLVSYVKRKDEDRAWTAKELRIKWLDRFVSEQKLFENEMAAFWCTQLMTGSYPGIVPYSMHRCTAQCLSFYCTLAAPAVVNGGYQRLIDGALRRREAAGNPPPVFASVVTSTRENFQLSKEGRRNLDFLEKYAGPSRVLLRSINETRSTKALRVHCWSPCRHQAV